MSYNPRHLVAGENPPSLLSQILANSLASWTAARQYSLPAGPATLPVPSNANFNPAIHGSHWQRFINATALEIEQLKLGLEEGLKGRFLEYPGFEHKSLDIIYEVQLPSTSTTVLAVSANLAAKTLPNTVDVNGNPIPDPNRLIDLGLTQVTRLFDFYYGLSQTVSFAASGTTTYVLPQRVGLNADGSAQIEWVTVNGVETTAYSLGQDQKTLTLNATAGSSVVVHFTTYDVFYVSAVDLPVLYLRSAYYEIFVATSGIALNSTARVNNLPTNVSVITPQIHMIWNELDEIGVWLAKPRTIGENNIKYKQRLLDAIFYPQDPTKTGLRNALATELGLVHHIQWGPGPFSISNGATANATTISLGKGNVYADSILVDRLPLEYYSLEPSGLITVNVPGLQIGDSATLMTDLVAQGGAIVPQMVPIKLSINAPMPSMATYDQIQVGQPTTSFTTQSAVWYPGSLQVWKNGIPLTSGTDFHELSNTVFTLATAATAGDVLQLGYAYLAGDAPLPLESQPELETDLNPVLRVECSYYVNPTAADQNLFLGWKNTPPGLDPATIPTNANWQFIIQVTNSGSASAAPFTISLQLPPNITLDQNRYLKISGVLDKNHTVSYIDGDEVWVNNVTDPAISDLLYDSLGRATPLLKAFAQELLAIAPTEWGEIQWDRTIWHTLNEQYQSYGFLPNVLDPDYSNLQTQRIKLSGNLTAADTSGNNTAIFGQAAFGKALIGTDANGNGFFIDFSSPGNAVGELSTVRYPDFRSGVGDGADLKLTIAPTNDPQWGVNIAPGTYYLNQEEHYFFSLPKYLETTSNQTFMVNAKPNSEVRVWVYDPSVGLRPMRRVYFHDSIGNLSLTNYEHLTGSGITRNLTYSDVHSITILSTADGELYIPQESSSNNQLTLDIATNTSMDVSYVLNESFIVVDAPNFGGSFLYLDKSYPQGVLIMYEGGDGSNSTDMDLHPYYQPRDTGFVYLSSNFYIPSTLKLSIDPHAVPADGVSTFTIRAKVTDNYGNGIDGIPVTILVNYSEGSLTWSGTTDTFGFVTSRFTASKIPQTAEVTASVQLFDQNGNPLSSLIDLSFVEIFNPYA